MLLLPEPDSAAHLRRLSLLGPSTCTLIRAASPSSSPLRTLTARLDGEPDAAAGELRTLAGAHAVGIVQRRDVAQREVQRQLCLVDERDACVDG